MSVTDGNLTFDLSENAVRIDGSSTANFIHQVPATIPAGSLTLLPGESTVIRTESGDVDQRWNISIAWSEI